MDRTSTEAAREMSDKFGSLPIHERTITDEAAMGIGVKMNALGMRDEGFHSSLSEATENLKAENKNAGLKLPPWREAAFKALVSGKKEDALATLGKMRERKSAIRQERLGLERQVESMEAESAAAEDFIAWARRGDFRIERATESVWHKLRDFLGTEHWDSNKAVRNLVNPEPMVFLVQHDWASAFAGAQDFEGGDFRLPFDTCVFEMKVSGRRIAALLKQSEDEDGGAFALCTQYGKWWTTAKGNLSDQTLLLELEPLDKLVKRTVKAICVAIDAEVAVADVVRAPYRLNASREKSGKTLLSDYHVVSLARRVRAAAVPDGYSTEGTRKRLHFRRGHWRHYANFKSWVRWCLVGNPDLGFIDKEYRA